VCSWNNITNGLFIEAPAGVGFSYADFPSGLVHNDSSTAIDNLNAVLYFFAGFPELAKNDFYISGESYAGIYGERRFDARWQQPSRVSNVALLPHGFVMLLR
jgi:carboxypeptidase C (cathepsin A)